MPSGSRLLPETWQGHPPRKEATRQSKESEGYSADPQRIEDSSHEIADIVPAGEQIGETNQPNLKGPDVVVLWRPI